MTCIPNHDFKKIDIPYCLGYSAVQILINLLVLFYI